jgi:hypothetical protein
MPELRLGNLDVCTSGLTQRGFRAAWCDLLLPITPENREQMLSEFKHEGELGGKYSGMKIYGISDLGFLRDFPMLLYLEVVDQEGFDARQLECLGNLRGLRVETPGTGIDFRCFPHLEVFSGDWHCDNRNMATARELRRIQIWHFKPRSHDLRDLADMTRLEQLVIAQTNIGSIDGLQTLEDLRYLEIHYASQLRSVAAVTGEMVDIREIAFSKLKKVESYQPLASIQKLRRLIVSDCAPMNDLKWTKGLNHLDFFSFVNTNVKDGDLSPLLELPAIRYIGTLNKRHYNFKADELNARLAQR